MKAIVYRINVFNDFSSSAVKFAKEKLILPIIVPLIVVEMYTKFKLIILEILQYIPIIINIPRSKYYDNRNYFCIVEARKLCIKAMIKPKLAFPLSFLCDYIINFIGGKKHVLIKYIQY